MTRYFALVESKTLCRIVANGDFAQGYRVRPGDRRWKRSAAALTDVTGRRAGETVELDRAGALTVLEAWDVEADGYDREDLLPARFDEKISRVPDYSAAADPLWDGEEAVGADDDDDDDEPYVVVLDDWAAEILDETPSVEETLDPEPVELPEATDEVEAEAEPVELPEATDEVEAEAEPVELPEATDEVEAEPEPVELPEATDEVEAEPVSLDTADADESSLELDSDAADEVDELQVAFAEIAEVVEVEPAPQPALAMVQDAPAPPAADLWAGLDLAPVEPVVVAPEPQVTMTRSVAARALRELADGLTSLGAPGVGWA